MDEGFSGPRRPACAPDAAQALCIALPWIGPWASGPSASVDQWLLTGLCTAGLILLRGCWPAARSSDSLLRAVALGWLLAAMYNTVVAICQYYGVADLFAALMSASPGHEPYSNLRQRNQFASLTVLGTAAALWFTTRGLRLSVALGAACLLAAGNAIAASRAGVLELLALVLLVAWWGGPHRKHQLSVMGAAVAAYLLAAWALPQLADRSMTYGALGRLGMDEGCFSRKVLWANVVDLIAHKPWTGWGWGELDFAHYATLYTGPRFCDVLDNAHNLPLHLAVELGIPVAVAACGVLAWFVAARAPWREHDAGRRLAWAALTTIGIHSAFEYPLWYGPFFVACVLGVWLVWPRPGAPGLPQDARFKPLAVATGLAMTALVLACGWQYKLVSQIYLPADQRMSGYRDDTLDKIRHLWAFRDQALFAELTITPLTPANAGWTFDAANRLLHFSPEPRVIEKLIESAVVLGRDDIAAFHMQRYRAAFPKEYAAWIKRRR